MSSSQANGGIPARRAVVRWAGRLFRRDWRQHLLILSLLTVAVAAAVGFSCLAFNVAPVSGQAEFGDANHFFRFNDPSPATLQPKLDAAKQWFGTIDAIGHRPVPLPGTVKQIDYRSQDPKGAFGKPMLRLRSGRYPAADDEVAVTNGVIDALALHIGSTIDLDGVSRTVVGTVENPSDLGDEFALLPTSALAQSKFVTMLVNASEARVGDFRPPGDVGRIISSRGDLPEDVVAAVLTLVVSTLVLMLVALIAASSFTVIAQRRLPQLGMMSAVGATEKHLRLAMLATGAATGVVAAVIGSGLGFIGWVAVAPKVGEAVGFRIDALNVPFWIVAVSMLLTVVAATAAAWWPGRAMSRIPTVLALSGRPPDRPALHRSAVLAVVCLVGGAVSLAVGSNVKGAPSGVDLTLIAVGLVAVVAGMLLVSPIAIQALARCASRVPIAARLALRDLSRYRSRSGAALAAIALVLGIAAALVATAAAAENNTGLGNLSPRQLMVHASDDPALAVLDSTTIQHAQEGVDALTAALPGAAATRLDVAVDPKAAPVPQLGGRPAIGLARPESDGRFGYAGSVYVASPALLSAYGLDASALAGKDIVTTESGELEIMGAATAETDRREPGERITSSGDLHETYSALPRALIAVDRLAARGWIAAPSGNWLVQTPSAMSSAQLNAARVIATQYGLKIESRDDHGRLGNIGFGAVAAGMLLALAILAMTVGLIRSESMGEMRTLTATGATASTRRSISAVTAGALAALGALIGIAGAYIALAAGRLSNLTPLPIGHLAVIAVGTPLVALAAGWIFAGREPAVIARRPLD
ncbi:MAG TPA: FtsX-like permease family protein [Acidimicrobiales bacterium]|nr:FtsX-like permease family protein [Acidimicrobiales bacterium]